jgi:hypothetical protein
MCGDLNTNVLLTAVAAISMPPWFRARGAWLCGIGKRRHGRPLIHAFASG